MPSAFPKTRLFFCISAVCWLAAASAAAQPTLLTWPDHPGGRLHRIDVQRRMLEAETAPEAWQPLGPVYLVDVDERDFPNGARAVGLPGKGTSRYLLVDCTQQVYRFDFATRTLTRLDRTYHRGYNCAATRFVRRDTLYCFGGYGFWHTNNVQSYYKADGREWESLNPQNDAPPSLYFGFNGYLAGQDRFLSALNYGVNDSEKRGAFQYDFNVYAYSFAARRWETLGTMAAALRNRLNFELDRETTTYWTGRYFVLMHYDSPRHVLFLVDPVRNEARFWEDRHKFLTNEAIWNRPNFAWGDSLVFYRLNESLRTKPVERATLSLAAVWREAQPLGAFYEPVGQPGPSPRSWWLGGVVLVALLGTGGWALWRARRRKPALVAPELVAAPDAGFPESLTGPERTVFGALLEAHAEGGLTGERLHEILGVADKMPENQRRIRFEVLRGLNTKLKLLLGVDEAVQRIPTSLDRRMFLYRLKPEVAERFSVVK